MNGDEMDVFVSEKGISMAEFNDYLGKYVNGEVDQYFYEYNKLSKGPKAIHVDSPTPTANPYLPFMYYDPIQNKPQSLCGSNRDSEECSMKLHIHSDYACPCVSKLINSLDNDELITFDNIGTALDDISEMIHDSLENISIFDNISEEFPADKISDYTADNYFDSSYPEPEFDSGSLGYPVKSPENFNFENDFPAPIFFNSDEVRSSTSTRIRHSEITDLQPDPKKLLEIGCRIDLLLQKYDISLISIKSKKCQPKNLQMKIHNKKNNKEKTLASGDAIRSKNQLGSRICRLKKRASVEASKIFFDAVRKEQENLLFVIKTMLEDLMEYNKENVTKSSNPISKLNSLISDNLSHMAAGYRSSRIREAVLSTAKQILSGVIRTN